MARNSDRDLKRALFEASSPDDVWLEALCRAIPGALHLDCPAIAACYLHGSPRPFEDTMVRSRGVSEPWSTRWISALWEALTAANAEPVVVNQPWRGSVRSELTRLGVPVESFQQLLAEQHLADVWVFHVVGQDSAACLVALLGPTGDANARWRRAWRRLESSIVTAFQIRCALRTVSSRVGSAGMLKEALVRFDQGFAESTVVPAGFSWDQLSTGELSLLEHFEANGRQYYLAYRHPEPGPSRRLSRRECQALELATQGCSNKVIADNLGVSQSSVGTLLARARRKLGALGLDNAWIVARAASSPNPSEPSERSGVPAIAASDSKWFPPGFGGRLQRG